MLYEKQSSFSGSKNNQWIDRLLQGQIQSIQLVFCTEAPSLGALFPPLVIQAAHRDRRRREIRCKKKKKKVMKPSLGSPNSNSSGLRRILYITVA